MASTDATHNTTFANQKDTFQNALMSLFSGKASETEADLSKLFTPTFKHYDEDENKIRDFNGWVAHIRWLREMLTPGSVNLTIVQFLRDGNQLAERHTSTTKMPNGKLGKGHTFQFMEIAEDGRIEWIVETVKREDPVKEGGGDEKTGRGRNA